ncbi:hypothetical protein THRCLA_20019 [Thraustotheca clavata]|uniref:Uncharacterized protein n=1 Tax=Thraustotheca clavata TaxID=74557 RepID=A0A1W0AD69_9STRA|nr:hypothetical protein THRCLA_20019 [Thraustotheca clavata]
MSSISDDEDGETTLSQVLVHSSVSSSSESAEESSEESSDDDEMESYLNDSSSSEEEPVDFVTQVGHHVKSAIKTIIGTPESRFENRTNTTLKWKEDVAYEKAKAEYLMQKQLEQTMVLQQQQEQKLETKRKRKHKLQKKANKKNDKMMANKTELCDIRNQKLDAKMTIVSEIRLHRLNVDAGNVLGFIRRKPPVITTSSSAPALPSPIPITEIEKSLLHKAKTEYRTEQLLSTSEYAETLGRKYGTLPAINTPPPIVHPEQIETTVELILRLAPPKKEEPQDKPQANSSKIKSLFTINLKRFRHVEICQGDHIGERGCVELGRSLLTGACPRLKHLNLGWNDIKLRGVASLGKSFAQGACTQLSHLDLKANNLDASGLQCILDALAVGGLQNLKHMVFSCNMIGDAGGKAIAHAFLKGSFRHLVTMDFKSNKIKNDGCRAIYNAFTADCFQRYGPALELIDLRRNQVNQITAQSFVPCPKHISF